MSVKTGFAKIIDFIAMQNAADNTDLSSIAVGGESGVFYSEAVGLPEDATFCFNVKATSGGVVKLIVDFENCNAQPETEGSADLNYVVPDGKSEVIADLNDQLAHRVPYSPAATKFGRFKITKVATNAASTVLSELSISYILAR